MDKPKVAITFDDGPNPKITPLILEVLKNKGVKATFFLIGKNAEKYPEIVTQIINAGQEVGNHTYTHQHLDELYRTKGADAVLEEIIKGDKAVRKAAHLADNRRIFLRAPYTGWLPEIDALARPIYGERIFNSGVISGDWNWDENGDWEEEYREKIAQKANAILDDVKRNVKPNTVISLHDSAEYCLPEHNKPETPMKSIKWMNRAYPTLKALPAIIDYLQGEGMTIVKLSELDFS